MSRQHVDDGLRDALKRDKHIVIHGSSKQGKTSLQKKILPNGYIRVTCSDRWTVLDLHNTILKQAGFRIERSTTQSASGSFKVNAFVGATAKVARETMSAPLEIDLWDVNDIISALKAANAPTVIVLEDYHYLPETTQIHFAVDLKAFHESSRYLFVVIGVWLDEDRLLQYNGDLRGRVVSD